MSETCCERAARLLGIEDLEILLDFAVIRSWAANDGAKLLDITNHLQGKGHSESLLDQQPLAQRQILMSSLQLSLRWMRRMFGGVYASWRWVSGRENLAAEQVA